MPIYARIISKPFPSAKELIRLDDRAIAGWHSDLPSYFKDKAQIPPKYRMSYAISQWKCQNFRIILYRPFVIRQFMDDQRDRHEQTLEESQAYDRCLREASLTILSVRDFWSHEENTMLGAWYAL
jgi:transcriptional regulatory protein GAL4